MILDYLRCDVSSVEGMVPLSIKPHSVSGAEEITLYTETARKQGPPAKPLDGYILPVWYFCTFEGQFITSRGKKCFKKQNISAFLVVFISSYFIIPNNYKNSFQVRVPSIFATKMFSYPSDWQDETPCPSPFQKAPSFLSLQKILVNKLIAGKGHFFCYKNSFLKI